MIGMWKIVSTWHVDYNNVELFKVDYSKYTSTWEIG